MILELAHELLPYAAILYVIDSFVRVRQGECAFVAPWRARFRRRGPGWHLAGLLPTSEVFVVDAPAAGAPGPSLQATLRQPALPAPAALDPAKLDIAAIRTRRALQARYWPVLSIAGALLFAVVFGALPAAVYRYRDIPVATHASVAAAAFLWAVILAISARALRRSGATLGAVASAIAPALFFPPAAGHVLTFLWREQFRGAPPMAVACVLLPPAEFRRIARQELRRLDEMERQGGGTPLEGGAPPAREALCALLTAVGLDPLELAASDPPQDEQAAVFCPLCEAEYRSGFITCTDCDVSLRAFSTRPGAG